MRLMCWNCQGLDNLRTVNALKDFITSYKPDMLFLMEIKSLSSCMEFFRSFFHFDGFFSVNRVGLGGDLSLMWLSHVSVIVCGYSSNFINCNIPEKNVQWRFTGYYGFPKSNYRRHSWNLIRALSHRSSLPWLCAEDFNDLCSRDEKERGAPHPTYIIQGFRSALEDSNLSQIPTVDSFYTWEKGRDSGNLVREKLDRVVATEDWARRFPNVVCSEVFVPRSDHLPLVIDTVVKDRRDGSRRFRFDNAWLYDDNLKEVVRNAWCNPAQSNLLSKRDNMISEIKTWERSGICSLHRKKLDLSNRLRTKTKGKRRMNRIDRLKDQSGTWLEDDLEVKNHVSNCEHVLKLVPQLVSIIDNEFLCAPFTNEEFRRALFQMHPDKSTRSERLEPFFLSEILAFDW
ncbi:hypothetical protein MANES_02G206350v8 [Manihot esculenta]|uniref:Uncharacterized protein n=1 Tax=Manihot esculenta TaxID=3983 RepID=A0ACB7I813_MANES|nr:hypothetical protein MANES_02G206350v8 [Manihot esculenta]